MTFDSFRRLVRGGEKATVDLKLICNAFRKAAGDYEKAKAELIKDICAMANNGSATSYLIIGISDDGRTVQSVADPNLNSQNVQTLVRDSIHPRVNVRVHRLSWPKAAMPFGRAKFVVIQIGPNGRHAFRLAKDTVNWNAKIHFRKHEVWRRNEDTSDLATPEQIVSLISKNRSKVSESRPDFENVDYEKLTKTEQLTVMAGDARELFKELGFKVTPLSLDSLYAKPTFRVCLKLHRTLFVFRCIFAEKMTTQGAQSQLVGNHWQLEHGLVTFLLSGFAPSAKFRGSTLDTKSDWGVFNLVVPTKIGWVRYGSRVPNHFSEVAISLLTLPRVRETRRLRESVSAMLETFESDESLFLHLDRGRRGLNIELRKWQRKSESAFARGWPSYRGEDKNKFRQQLNSISALLSHCKAK